jgi:histone-arginine methyltransferase CARM1
MLQDVVRTSTYRNAILQNPSLFQDKLVMDIGAGSGILSYFAAQAGARVIAVEASNMALKLKKILDSSNKGESNLWMKDRIKVVIGKIEEAKLNIEKVDTIISEPIGVMLVHERMVI